MSKKTVRADITKEEEDALAASFSTAELQNEVMMNANDMEDDVQTDAPDEPKMTDPEWPAFVMRHFSENELDQDGSPRVHGLRRVARLLLGPIIESVVIPVQAPTLLPQLEKLGMLQPAVMAYRIKILMCKDLDPNQPAYETTFADVADVYHANTDPDYARHPSATAATKAEARCLRKALQLSGVASEEKTLVPTLDADPNKKITPEQINFLNLLGRRNNIDIMKFINSGKTKYSNVEDIPFGTALKMVEHLSNLQNDSSKVQADIKGYKADWRK